MKISKYLRAWRLNLKSLKRLDYKPTNKGIIISLTTVPSRIAQIKPTLVSLLTQTTKADQIEINLGKKPQKKDIDWKIPAWLTELKAVKLFWLDHDYGPATKFIPTLERHKKNNSLIIVVDDDMLYPKDLIKSLYGADSNSVGKHAYCANGHTIYQSLDLSSHPSDKRITANIRRVAIIQGCGGYSIRPDFFNLQELTNESTAPKGGMKIDDVWISGHLSRQKIKKWQIPTGKRKSLPQALTPAISGARNTLSNQLAAYFKDDWSLEEIESV